MATKLIKIVQVILNSVFRFIFSLGNKNFIIPLPNIDGVDGFIDFILI